MAGVFLWGWCADPPGWVKVLVNPDGKLIIDPSEIFENPPTDGETAKGAQSDWCYDHWKDASAHHANTKEIWVAGNFHLQTNATRVGQQYHPVVRLADAVTYAMVDFGFRVPHDFSSLLANYPKVVLYAAAASGDVRLRIYTYVGASGQSLGNRIDSISEFTQPIVQLQLLEVDISAAFDGLSLAAGDQVSVVVYRNSDDALDTLADNLDVLGVVVRYT